MKGFTAFEHADELGYLFSSRLGFLHGVQAIVESVAVGFIERCIKAGGFL